MTQPPATTRPRRARPSTEGASASPNPRRRREGSLAAELGTPRQSEIMLPLVQALAARGGAAKPGEAVNGRSIYDDVANQMRIPARILAAKRPDGRTPVWSNLVQWARQSLVASGHLDPSVHGVWKLTAKGRRAAACGRL